MNNGKTEWEEEGRGEEWAVGNDGEYQRKSSQMRKNIYFISIDDATL